MSKLLLLLGLLASGLPAAAQNIYPEKFDGCHLQRFCLDCGDPGATYPTDLTSYFAGKLPAAALRRATGGALVQVLVDSTGVPCALSQATNLPPQVLRLLDLRGAVNSMGSWLPAQEKGKPVASSVSIRFSFQAGSVQASYQHIPKVSEMRNMRSVGKVELLNTRQHYESPRGVTISTFTTENSPLPWDMSRAVAVDQQGTVWAGTDNGLVVLRGQDPMQVLNARNSGLLAGPDTHVGISAAAVDGRGHKWFTSGYHTYRFDGQTWTRFDSTNSPLRWVVRIVPDAAGNVWFGGSRGLARFDGSQWTELTARNSQLPAGLVSGVFVDQQRRVWASTDKGCVRLEANGQMTTFAGGATPLASTSFTCAAQDGDGTLWLGLRGTGQQEQGSGLARLSPQGEWRTFTADNSGYPGHGVQALLIDPQHVVWAGVNRIGLCRYDGRTWTLYTPENSAVPSTIVYDLALGTDGTLWGATFAGLFALRPC